MPFPIVMCGLFPVDSFVFAAPGANFVQVERFTQKLECISRLVTRQNVIKVLGAVDKCPKHFLDLHPRPFFRVGDSPTGPLHEADYLGASTELVKLVHMTRIQDPHERFSVKDFKLSIPKLPSMYHDSIWRKKRQRRSGPRP